MHPVLARRQATSGSFNPATAGLGPLFMEWRPADLLLASGGAIGAWVEGRGTADSTWTQGTGASQPTFQGAVTPQARGAVRFDGTNDYMQSTATIALAATTGWSVHAWLNTDLSGASQILIQDQSILQLFPGATAGGQVGWRDTGATRAIAAPASGWQVLSWVFDPAGPTGTMYRDGALLGSAAWDNTALAGTWYLGTNSVQSVFVKLDLAALLWYQAVHDASKVQIAQAGIKLL